MRSASPAARWISRGSFSSASIQLFTYAALFAALAVPRVVADPDALAGHHCGDLRPEFLAGVGGAAEASRGVLDGVVERLAVEPARVARVACDSSCSAVA